MSCSQEPRRVRARGVPRRQLCGAVVGERHGYYPWFGLGAYGLGYSNWSAYSDPWYGAYPSAGAFDSLSTGDEGAIRLKIKPNDARAFVDGQYVGIVDDFDGVFQKLHISGGGHRIEVQADGYETLVFAARIAPSRTTTYQGDLKRLP